MSDPTNTAKQLRDSAALMYKAAYEIERLEHTLTELSEAIRRKKENSGPPIDREFLERPVRTLNFGRVVTSRMHGAFHHHTVRDLVRLTERELIREPNIGRVSMKRVRSVLAEHGLYLGMNV